MDRKTALIIGGSSGLGLELGRLLPKEQLIVLTGRRDPEEKRFEFKVLDIGSEVNQLSKDLDSLLKSLPKIELLIYAAGFYQEGTIASLNDEDIAKMANVGLLAPALVVSKILKKQSSIEGFIPITSTSEWTPRLNEPMYTATKAGLGMLAKSLSLDPAIKKTLHVGPSGMKTRFWENNPRDTSKMLDPRWVAEEILKAWPGNYKYKYLRVLREPARVEVVEERIS